ncbi:MAG TPA: DegQ family serine endoprotease [Desulfobacterales bacterium]|nr:DegQ family serine endoprotease [Desulfobacterales bacterium]
MFFNNYLSTNEKRVVFAAIFLGVGTLILSGVYPVPDIRAASAPVMGVPESFSHLAERVSPAVVNIRTEKMVKGGGQSSGHFSRPPFEKNDPFHDFFEKFFGDKQQKKFKKRSLGSGFVIGQEGYIVTNNHVIENADKIKVKLKNGKKFDAELVGRDPNTDIALIRVKPVNGLPVVDLGDSDGLKVGQWVVAIGNPFGLEHTVTAGIVSAKGRVIGSGPYDDYIQTDASINPGNSGGPLINMKGEVMGINTAIIAGGQGIGFAIPINLAKGIIDQLKENGEVTRGWLGVGIQDLDDELAAYYGLEGVKGVLVSEAFQGEPAEKAGIQAKDIILEVNGKKVNTSRALSRMVANIRVGDEITIKVLRDSKEKIFNVKIAKRDENFISSRRTKKEFGEAFGVRVATLTKGMAKRLNMEGTDGVVVVEVASGSKGEKAGIRVHDNIKEINRKEIKTVDDYREAIRKTKKGASIQMFIRRMNVGFLVVTFKK